MNTLIYGKLGTHVVYTASNGKQKTALVVGDPDSVVGTDEVGGPNDGAVPALGHGERHLMVFSPTGSVYLKQNVPHGTDVANHWYTGTGAEG